MQKLSVNAGFTCPNRDGSIGTGGCTYCNNASFSPSYCDPSDPVTTQLEKARRFSARNTPICDISHISRLIQTPLPATNGCYSYTPKLYQWTVSRES